MQVNMNLVHPHSYMYMYSCYYILCIALYHMTLTNLVHPDKDWCVVDSK